MVSAATGFLAATSLWAATDVSFKMHCKKKCFNYFFIIASINKLPTTTMTAPSSSDDEEGGESRIEEVVANIPSVEGENSFWIRMGCDRRKF
jgi:hypothetical protein